MILSFKYSAKLEYARKSPEELFAEAFGLSFAGKKLPQKLSDLLDKHLRSLINK